jgi:spermidine synthase
MSARRRQRREQRGQTHAAPPGARGAASHFPRLLQGVVLVSGAAALVYQSVWIRQLSLILGSTNYAVGTVLAAFMAGLGAGAFVIGRRADRVPRPLALYAWLELGIGIVGLVSPFALAQGNDLYATFYRRLHDAPGLLTLARFAIGFGFVFVPAFLMGGTLPAATRHLAAGGFATGPAVGRLYAINTLGAACGALLLPYALLPALGLRATLVATALTNLALAGAAARGARSFEVGAPAPHVAASAERPHRAGLLAAFFVSGFVALALEVLWNRFFSMYIGSSIYSYAIVLAVYLVGVFLGGLVCERLLAVGRRPDHVFVGCLLTVLGALAVTVPVMDRILYAQVAVLRVLGIGFWPFQAASVFAAALVLLVPTVAFGASFPAVTAALTRRAGEAGGALGLAYLVNTCGTTLGSIAASFLLIPVLGLRASFGALAALLGICAMLAASGGWARRPAFVAAVVALASLPSVLPAWDLRRMHSSINNDARTIMVASDQGVLDQALAGITVLDMVDGVDATVSVARYPDGEQALLVNGKGDASDGVDMFTQLVLGYLPLSVRLDARDVLVVGMGSGVTLGAVLRHAVGRVDLVEISPEVLELGGHYFERVNRNALLDPRVVVHVEDGRNFIAFGDDREYDVVISEPSNPWMTGVANLFTTEFFAQVKSRLRPRGILAQWFHHYGMDLDDVRSLLATVRAHFPYVYVFAFHHRIEVAGDMILLASEVPIDFAPALAAMQDGVAADDLRPFGMGDPAALAGGFVLGPRSLETFVGTAAINSDDHPRIELNAPRNVMRDTAFDNLEALLAASDGAILPTSPGAHGVGPQLTRGPAGGRAAGAGLRLVVGTERAKSGLQQRSIATEVVYETDAGPLRVVGVAGVVPDTARAALAARLDGGKLEPVGEASAGGHAAQRYRRADGGGDVVVWSCPSQDATFVAFGDPRLVAGVACDP